MIGLVACFYLDMDQSTWTTWTKSTMSSFEFAVRLVS
jgi:hypothetical protein